MGLRIIAAGLVSFALAAHVDLLARQPSFTVAITDGWMLLPIARVSDGEWINTWPEPEDMEEPVPSSLDEVPDAWLDGRVPRRWDFWFASGGRASASVKGLQRMGGCASSPGLTLADGIQARADHWDEHHQGIATDRPVNASSIRRLRESDAGFTRRLPTLVALFQKHERAAVANTGWLDDEGRERLSERLLAGVTVRLEWLFETEVRGQRHAYFEIAKRIRLAGDVDQRVVVRGWLISDSQGDRILDGLEALVDGDDHPDRGTRLPSRIPLGALDMGRTAIWVFEEPHGETVEYRLYEVGDRAVTSVLATYGGGC